MRRNKIITNPVQLNELNFEDLFEEIYEKKIKHDWQNTPVRPHLRELMNHYHKKRHA
jgi:hypothetical protein